MDGERALVIGGTGMLRRATIAIAQLSRKLTLVARTRASLDALAGFLPHRESDCYQTLDWSQPEEFLLDLQRLAKEVGHPTLVLAWLHDINLGPRVAMAVSTPETPCDFFQVMGSSVGSPHGCAATLLNQVKDQSNLRYFQIVLGFKREAGASRWLTNDEISDGVLEAMTARESFYIVGTVTPWELRPH